MQICENSHGLCVCVSGCNSGCHTIFVVVEVCTNKKKKIVYGTAHQFPWNRPQLKMMLKYKKNKTFFNSNTTLDLFYVLITY